MLSVQTPILMVIRSFNDIKNRDESDSDHEDKPGKPTNSYVGGGRSGLAVKNPKNNKVIITQYPNGITVNDGPLMAGDDPRTQTFLQNLTAGEVPEELREFANSATGELSVELKRVEEPYSVAVAPKEKLFSGSAQTLSSGSTPGASTQVNPPTVQISDSRPVTTVQIRWPTGGRLAQRFNEDFTISQLFDFVQEACGQPVSISAGFPPAQLQRSDETLLKGNLCNSAITVRVLNQ